MARLKAALIREYEDNDEVDIEVHNPRNTEAVTLNFRGEKLAKVSPKTFLQITSHMRLMFQQCVKALDVLYCRVNSQHALLQVMGSLTDKKCVQGQRVSGILIKRNFNYHIVTPSDLSSQYHQHTVCVCLLFLYLCEDFSVFFFYGDTGDVSALWEDFGWVSLSQWIWSSKLISCFKYIVTVSSFWF